MQIKTASFYRSVSGIENYFNKDLPEIAVVGKSNVGKSTLVNMLTNNGNSRESQSSRARRGLSTIF